MIPEMCLKSWAIMSSHVIFWPSPPPPQVMTSFMDSPLHQENAPLNRHPFRENARNRRFFLGRTFLADLRTLYVTRDTWVPQKHNWQSKVTFDTLNTEMILTKHSPEIFNDQPLTKGNQNHQGVESNLD